MQQFSSLTFICDNMMLLALNEHLNASLVALATCITAEAYQGIKNLWSLAIGVPPPWSYNMVGLALKTFLWAHVSLTCYQAISFVGSSSAAMSPRVESLIETFAPLTHSDGVEQCNIYI